MRNSVQDCHGKNSFQQEEDPSDQQNGCKFKKKNTSKVLHLMYSFVWCRNLTLWKVDQKYLESFEM